MDIGIDKQTQRIVFVLPTFNEEDNIKNTIQQIFEQFTNLNDYICLVLVVDDNSPDETQSIVTNLIKQNKNIFLLTGPKTGLGNAYKRGFKYAIQTLEADIVFQMDSDGQHDTSLISLFLDKIESGYDVVIGSRFTEGGSIPNFSFFRRFISRVGNFLVRYVGGVINIKDCTSGYRAIKTSYLEEVDFTFLSTAGYSFQSSLICDLVWRGAKVSEIPITFGERKAGDSKLSLNDQVEFLLNIPRLGFRNMKDFIKYSLVGLSGVFVNLGVYTLLTRYFEFSEIFAPLISIEVALISNFILNNFWTFGKRVQSSRLRLRFFKFHIASGLAALFNYLIFLILFVGFDVYDILANLIGIGIAAIANYLINSNWTWRRET